MQAFSAPLYFWPRITDQIGRIMSGVGKRVLNFKLLAIICAMTGCLVSACKVPQTSVGPPGSGAKAEGAGAGSTAAGGGPSGASAASAAPPVPYTITLSWEASKESAVNSAGGGY